MEIEVTRPKQSSDSARDYHLLADGKEVAAIKCGTTQTVTLPKGSKKLKAVIDWCSSPEFNVSDICAGRIVVKNSFFKDSLKSFFAGFYYVTIGRKRYLKIETGLQSDAESDYIPGEQ